MQFKPTLFVLSLWALASSAAVVPGQKRSSEVEVALSSPSASVASVNDISIVASITNHGAEAVKLFKYATILDDKPTSSFKVTKNGKAVAFTGVKLSISVDHLDDTAFTTIQAGETIQVVHNVGSLYDFASAGTGTFSFEPRTNFHLADEEDVSVSTFSDVGVTRVANTVAITVTKDVGTKAVQAEGSQFEKRARTVCSNTSRASFITASYTEGKSLASRASSYVTSRGASDSLFVAYWSTNTVSRVAGVFNTVANENSSSRTLSCTDTYGVCGGGVIAYTVISSTNIYYCSIFFNEVPTANLCSGTTVASRNVRGGTTLHELTHAVSGTDDVTYGCAADQRLSASQKIINADNYNCFATQVYANTVC